MTVALEARRQEVRGLLNEFDAADGLASYYALHHDPARTSLFTHHDDSGGLVAYLARCQTGYDLFRPVVTLRVRGADVPPALLREGLQAGRPYLLLAPHALFGRLTAYLAVADAVRHTVMRLDPAQFEPIINVLAVTRLDVQGLPRSEILRGDTVLAAAGVNWRSPLFAEVWVRVEPVARGRGWGKAVVSACAESLLRSGVTPLYLVDDHNRRSLELAHQLGFVDTGAREVMAQAVLDVG